jgi:hypothetical protein
MPTVSPLGASRSLFLRFVKISIVSLANLVYEPYVDTSIPFRFSRSDTMRIVAFMPLFLLSLSQAQADETCMATCGYAFNHCVMHVGPGNDWALEVCGEALVECEKRCEATPVVPFWEEPAGSETDTVAKKK